MPNPLLPTGKEKEKFVREMFDSISPTYDRLNRLLTFRVDQIWRKQALRELNPLSHAQILDLACGTGDFVKLARSQGYRCIGTDFSMGMLQHSNLTDGLVVSDGLNLAFRSKSFDGVTCGFALRNFRELPPVFNELFRILKQGGRISLLEVGQPSSRLLRIGHDVYFNKVVPFIGGLLSDAKAYSYLPASVSYLPTTEQITSMLEDAGFSQIRHTSLLTGAAQVFSATKA